MSKEKQTMKEAEDDASKVLQQPVVQSLYDTQVRTLKMLQRGSYDIQKERINIGLRIVANWKAKHGQVASAAEREMDSEGKKILKTLRKSYKRLTDGLTKHPSAKKFQGHGIISELVELRIIGLYERLLSFEKSLFNTEIANALKEFDVWNDFLVDVPGVGPAMAAVLLTEMDIRKAKHPSSLHKYCGLDVVIDENGVGVGRGRAPEHMEEVEYVDKDGNTATRMSLTFKPLIKSKVCEVLMDSFIKARSKPKGSKYADLIYDHRNRTANDLRYAPTAQRYVQRESDSKPVSAKVAESRSNGHRWRMAKRYAAKIFLNDLYAAWRRSLGLPVSLPYHEAKLGLHHGTDVQRAPDAIDVVQDKENVA